MNIFGWEIVSTYTRTEAVADGVQVAIPQEISREAGILHPVFLTRSVYDKYVRVPQGMDFLDEEGRLYDLLFVFAMQAKKSTASAFVFEFVCYLPDDEDWTIYERICEGNKRLREVSLKAVIGPMDINLSSPAITIMVIDED